MKRTFVWATVIAVGLFAQTAHAQSVLFDTGSPDGRMAMASRPQTLEIEAADDFLFTGSVSLTGATFTGLFVPSGGTVSRVVVELYRVFPQDSNLARTPTVPTRTNSPSDVAFDSRDSALSNSLTFTTSVLNASFSANNSVLNGINPKPSQTTGGEGPVTGQEVRFTVTFTTPFALAPGHYFFVPQVQLSSGQFYWLSAAHPLFTGDLQAWIRNANLAPDWLRVGTDIVGGSPPPTFNGSFSLSGLVVATATPTDTPTNTPTNTPTTTPTSAPTATPTSTPPSTQTPTPAPVQVPTLSFPMLAVLGLALLGMGFLLSRRS
jgi:hypothetical protein